MGEGNTSDEVPERGAALPFGARLLGLRQAAGLTQEELASRAGLSPNAVSALERGVRRRPQPHTVRAISEALGLSEDERAALLAAVPKRGGPAPSAAEASPASPAPVSLAMSALPRPVTPLVGREREIEEVRDLLTQQGIRLLTLTGMGGVGKTRLAVEAAREASGLFPDGAAFVELAPLSDPSLVVPAVSRSLGLPEAQGRAPGEALIDHLRDKSLLLVLDNLEHLLGAAPEVAAVVEGCPGLVVLATSRAPLRVRGEREYPVLPLALPASTRSPGEEEVLASPSGRLFVERARAASPGFTITRENAPSVAAICWRLAGLPLALELAAVKARFLDPATLLSRLDRALSGAWARDLPERQRTMRATLDWSHELLEESERELFRRLSAFSGGFTLEAAEAVGAGPVAAGSVGSEDVLDLLGTLVEQSLVVTGPGSGGHEARYGMLEPVRQYAREKLEQSGEAEDVLRGHAGFFLALSQRAASEMWSPRQEEWLERLERESGNLHAAISWALEAGEGESAARFGWSLNSFWFVRGYHREGRRWMEATLEGPLPSALRARALHVVAIMAYAQGDYPAAEERWGEALRLSHSERDILAEAMVWAGTGLIEMVRPDFEAAASRIEKALSLLERHCEDPSPEGYGEDPQSVVTLTRVLLGTTLLARGDLGGARQMFEEGLKSARRRGDPIGTYVGLYNLAQLALARGDLALAARTLEEGIELSGRTKDRANLAHFLDALAAVASSRGEAERSALLLGAAEALLEEVGARVHNYYVPDPSIRKRTVAEARTGLGDAAFEEAWARGRGMGFEQAVRSALGADATRGDSVCR